MAQWQDKVAVITGAGSGIGAGLAGAGSVDAGMSPRDFAALVFAGIESDTFWLIPQKALKPLVQARYQGIEDESNPLPLT
ncbi:MAG: hypothetical protein KDI09_05160 [Halioglobus sp.]|nr:hypothetical protein [Halioglobus sp.]